MESGSVLQGENGAYRLEALLARGGFGVTWRATQVGDGAEVVIKQLRMERLESWKALELFEREASVLQSLDHRGVVRYVDHFKLEGTDALALVQRFVPGHTLHQVMRSTTRLPEAQMLSWFHQMLEVCVYLHERSPAIIHRDITPKNVIFSEGGDATLIDFGTVQAALRSAHSVSSTSAGTFGYASMEQLVGRALPASDLYGLGMTYVAVAAGHEPEHLPYEGARVDVRAALEAHDVDPRLRLMLEQMTHPDPSARPASARAILERLKPLWSRRAEPEGITAPVTTPSAAPSLPSTPAQLEPGEPDPAAIWIEARARLARIPEPDRLGAPPRFERSTTLERALADPTGRWLILCDYYTCCSVDLSTGEVTWLVKNDRSGKRAAFSPSGSTLVIGEGYTNALYVFDVGDEGIALRSTFTIEGDKFGEISAMAISPDETMIALTATWHQAIVDLSTGAELQPLEGVREAKSLAFSPSGDALLARGDEDGMTWLGMSGAVKKLDDKAWMIQSRDGRDHVVAVRDSDDIYRLYFVRGEDPFDQRARARHQLKIDLGFEPRQIEAMALSEQGDTLLLAAVDETSDRTQVVAIDLHHSRVIARFKSPFERTPGWPSYHDINLTLSASRVFVGLFTRATPFAHEQDQAIFIFDLSTAEHLGTLRGLSSETTEALSRPGERSIAERADQLDQGASPHSLLALIDRAGVFGIPQAGPDASSSPYEQLDLMRARLVTGERYPDSIPSEVIDRIQDMEVRCTLGDQFEEDLDYGAPLANFLEASRGLTHLTPWIVARAREMTAAMPRFGAPTTQSSSMGKMADAALELQRRPEDEREVLFEEMISKIRDREAARRREAKKAAAQRELLASRPVQRPAESQRPAQMLSVEREPTSLSVAESSSPRQRTTVLIGAAVTLGVLVAIVLGLLL